MASPCVTRKTVFVCMCTDPHDRVVAGFARDFDIHVVQLGGIPNTQQAYAELAPYIQTARVYMARQLCVPDFVNRIAPMLDHLDAYVTCLIEGESTTATTLQPRVQLEFFPRTSSWVHTMVKMIMPHESLVESISNELWTTIIGGARDYESKTASVEHTRFRALAACDVDDVRTATFQTIMNVRTKICDKIDDKRKETNDELNYVPHYK